MPLTLMLPDCTATCVEYTTPSGPRRLMRTQSPAASLARSDR